MRGVKTFPGRKKGSLPFLTGGSCKATTMGGEGREEKLLMRERNTSQLPRVLCCTMERERATPPACGRGGEGVRYSISGPSPGHQVGRERGWGPPGGAGRQPLEWGEQQRGEQNGDWSAELPPRRPGGGGGPWGGQEGVGFPQLQPHPPSLWCPSLPPRGAGVQQAGRFAKVQAVGVWGGPGKRDL